MVRIRNRLKQLNHGWEGMGKNKLYIDIMVVWKSEGNHINGVNSVHKTKIKTVRM